MGIIRTSTGISSIKEFFADSVLAELTRLIIACLEAPGLTTSRFDSVCTESDQELNTPTFLTEYRDA
jgi:hypothetical protein